jgi:hypothetical protein
MRFTAEAHLHKTRPASHANIDFGAEKFIV